MKLIRIPKLYNNFCWNKVEIKYVKNILFFFVPFSCQSLRVIAFPFDIGSLKRLFIGNITEVFGKFTNKEGKFNQKLGENIKGMVDLYEASQLGIIGEDILAEAGEFSGQVLKEKVDCIDNLEAMFVKRTLEHPFHKSFPMFTARNFFGDFDATNTWLGSLKEVAKMDFSLLQCMYHREITQISKYENLTLTF